MKKLWLSVIAIAIALIMLWSTFVICKADFAESAMSLTTDLSEQMVEIGISEDGVTSKAPAVAYNPNQDEYLVVWRSQQSDGYDVRAQRIRSDGSLVNKPFTVTSPISTSWPTPPTIAYNSQQEEYLIVWNNEATGRLQGQRVHSDGMRMGSVFTIVTSLNVDPHSPALIYTPDADVFMLAWRGCLIPQQSMVIAAPIGGAPCYFYTQILSSTGVTIREDITATTNTYMQVKPGLTYAARRREFWIVWTERYTITAQRVLTSGELIGEPFAIFTQTTDSDLFNPDISNLSNEGEFLVTWENHPNVQSQFLYPFGGGHRDIYARRVLSNGTPISDSFHISSRGITGNEPKVIYLTEQNQYLITWVSLETSDNYRDLYMRWVSADGMLIGRDFPVAVAAESQHNLALDGRKAALIVWEDERGLSTIRGRILERSWWLFLPVIVRAA